MNRIPDHVCTCFGPAPGQEICPCEENYLAAKAAAKRPNPFAKLKIPKNKGEEHTFNEWNDKGYFVMRGEKATGRTPDGVATFTRNQVIDKDLVKEKYRDDDFFEDMALNRF